MNKSSLFSKIALAGAFTVSGLALSFSEKVEAATVSAESNTQLTEISVWGDTDNLVPFFFVNGETNATVNGVTDTELFAPTMCPAPGNPAASESDGASSSEGEADFLCGTFANTSATATASGINQEASSDGTWQAITDIVDVGNLVPPDDMVKFSGIFDSFLSVSIAGTEPGLFKKAEATFTLFASVIEWVEVSPGNFVEGRELTSLLITDSVSLENEDGETVVDAPQIPIDGVVPLPDDFSGFLSLDFIGTSEVTTVVQTVPESNSIIGLLSIGALFLLGKKKAS